MFKRLGTFVVLAVCLFTIAIVMVGCGNGEDDEPSEFLKVYPADGSTIQDNERITVHFDTSGKPYNFEIWEVLEVPGANVTEGALSSSARISGPFATGPLTLELQWEGQTATLNYTVVNRHAEAMAELVGSYTAVEIEAYDGPAHPLTGDLTLSSDSTFQMYLKSVDEGTTLMDTEGTWSVNADTSSISFDHGQSSTITVNVIVFGVVFERHIHISGSYTWDGTRLEVSGGGGDIRWERN